MIRKVLALALVGFCTGCASNFSAMVRFTPAQPWDSRSPDQLYDAVNHSLPFTIDPGDFVASKGMDGPSCWVCLGDPAQTKQLLKALKACPEWKITSIGQVANDHRELVGLAPQPGYLSNRNRVAMNTP